MTETADDVGSRRAVPATARGRRSRQALLDAARVVFARDGFTPARITDIADAAGAAHGSFYTYFKSKDEIFLALIEELESDLRVPAGDHSAGDDDAYAAILRANADYLRAYRENRGIMVVWEQAASLHPEVAELRREASDRAVARIVRAIERMQADGDVPTAIDARYAATALTGMVSNFAYRWCLHGLDFDLDTAAEQLSRLWANALGLPTP
jgi:AcrR family transcriptional regulator